MSLHIRSAGPFWRQDTTPLGRTGAALHVNRCTEGRYSDPPSGTLRLYLIPALPCEMRVSVAGQQETQVPVGALQLVAPEHPMRWEQEGVLEELELELPKACWLTAFGGAMPDFAALSGRRFHDPLLRALLERLWADEADSDEVLATASLHMATALLRRHTATRPPSNRMAGMAPDRLTRAQAVLLHPDGTVAEAAAASGLCGPHFMRAFKATTGETPGEFQRRHRVSAAMARLREGATPIAQIAIECGFADQAHMTRMFRTVVGMTPGQVRREARPA